MFIWKQILLRSIMYQTKVLQGRFRLSNTHLLNELDVPLSQFLTTFTWVASTLEPLSAAEALFFLN